MRKKLIGAGIEIKEQAIDEYKALKNKILFMRGRGLSYQAIADQLNLWRVSTKTGDGSWHAKTVRDLERD